MVDPLRRAVHGSTVELLRGSIHESIRGSVNLTRKDAETERYLRKALLRVPQMDGSDETHLKRMVAAMEQVRVAPREIICRIGDPGDFLYAIQSGRVELRGEHHNQLLMPGDTFGEEVLDTGEALDYNAFANGAVLAWRLHRRVFRLLQMSMGDRLRQAITQVIEQQRDSRAAAGPHLSAMQKVVMNAMARKREREELHKSLVWSEFADVPAAIEQMKRHNAIGKGAFGEVTSASAPLLWPLHRSPSLRRCRCSIALTARPPASQVHLCVHAPTKRTYALKVQTYKNAKDAVRMRSMIDREIDCMREGASPFLMRFYGEHDEGPGVSSMLLECAPRRRLVVPPFRLRRLLLAASPPRLASSPPHLLAASPPRRLTSSQVPRWR
jgi:CRP-like cAMP-binding protein